MRVIIVGSFAGSLVNFRGALITRIKDLGHDVHVCAPGLSTDDATRTWLEARGVVCHDIPLSRTGMNPFADLRALVNLALLMVRIKPDFFLGYTIKPVIWGLFAAKLARIPKRAALITGLGYAFTGRAFGRRAVIQRIARLLYARALQSSHVVFFQNPDDLYDFKLLGLLPDKANVRIINGSGVDIEHFPNAPLPTGPTRFLLIARLLKDKGIFEYAAAAEMIAKRYPNVEFHLAGMFDPSPDGLSQSEVDTLTKSGVVAWQGPLSDVRSAIAGCHVYVLPSYREGTPRTVLEAMSTGRAILTTDAPGCRETVIPGQNGFLVPVQNAHELAESMEKFIVTPGLIIQMGAKSRRIAEEKYDVHKVNAEIIDAIGL
jgi:glycosyltransferase involved in cell wall biosynthesis